MKAPTFLMALVTDWSRADRLQYLLDNHKRLGDDELRELCTNMLIDDFSDCATDEDVKREGSMTYLTAPAKLAIKSET
jgi:hypothetical protein